MSLYVCVPAAKQKQQENQNTTEISMNNGKSNTDAGIKRAVKAARAQGLRVTLKPHVDLLNDADHWRGEIGMHFSESDWTSWFTSCKVVKYK